jgi:hypothetical protein
MRDLLRVVQFTDGAWEGGGAQSDKKNGPPPPAGWGVLEAWCTSGSEEGELAPTWPRRASTGGGDVARGRNSPNSRNDNDVARRLPLRQLLASDKAPTGPAGDITWAANVRVVLDVLDPDYIGAPGDTNNTGELTAPRAPLVLVEIDLFGVCMLVCVSTCCSQGRAVAFTHATAARGATAAGADAHEPGKSECYVWSNFLQWDVTRL